MTPDSCDTAPSVIRSMRSNTILPSVSLKAELSSAAIGTYFWMAMVPPLNLSVPRYSPALATVTSKLGSTANQSEP